MLLYLEGKRSVYEMKKLLMLGTSQGSCEMIRIARAKGIYTIVTDFDLPEKSIGKLIADEYWMINTADMDALEKRCREEQIDVVVCGVSEFNLERTMELTERLGLPCYCTPEAWHFSRNKHDFKKLCKKIGVRMAEDYQLSNPPTDEELSKVKFPVVVKAINLSANRGMSYCYNREELIEACEYARSVSKNDTIIVERMLKGPEVSADYIMTDGEVRLLSVNNMISQPGYPQHCYSITTTENKYVRKFIKEENNDIIRVLKEVGCKEGLGWVETILDEDGHFYLLEMGYRLCGNEINIPLRELTGFDVHEWIIEYALGKKHKISDVIPMQSDYHNGCGCVYCLWSNQSGTIGMIDGVEEVLKDKKIYWDSLVKEGDFVEKHSLIAEFAFVDRSVEEMCETIALINGRIDIRSSEDENMIIRFTDFDNLRYNNRNYAE